VSVDLYSSTCQFLPLVVDIRRIFQSITTLNQPEKPSTSYAINPWEELTSSVFPNKRVKHLID
jgi:hypothetical protein